MYGTRDLAANAGRQPGGNRQEMEWMYDGRNSGCVLAGTSRRIPTDHVLMILFDGPGETRLT